MIVIKLGGSMFSRMENLLDDLKGLVEPFILVHGGAAESTAIAEKLGTPPRFITSPSGFKSRHTDYEQIEIFKMVVAGKINKTIVAELRRRGINAIGLTGVDGGLLQAEKKITRSQEGNKVKMIRDDYTGKVGNVNVDLLNQLIGNGYVPVIAPLSISKEFEVLNCDGDRAASKIAQCVHAKRLMLFTDVDGYFRNFPHDLAGRLELSELDECIENASAGMKRKLIAAKEAIINNVNEVIIANGTVEKPISNAVWGKRTTITKGISHE